MTDRTRIPAPFTAAADDIRDHGYAIVQTRIERVPPRYRAAHCTDLEGCDQPATLLTLAIAAITEEGEGDVGFSFARAGGEILRTPTCDAHRCEASHDLYFVLTERTRPEGIRAFDVPGQHLSWT